jgi:folate-dependent phosphoribosylglycinamide formyltransferase PurN
MVIIRHSSPLPEVPGAKIDRSSLTVGDGGVLVHYISSDVDYGAATQAIIVIHGRQRDANNSFAAMHEAVETANQNNVVIMAVRALHRFQKGDLIS